MSILFQYRITIMFLTQNQKADREAKRIRDQLYARVARKYLKLKHSFDSIDNNNKNFIQRSSATELVELMDEGKITSLETTLTFIERTATIGIKNNYIIDQMFEQAILMAKKCDEVRAQNKGKRSWRLGDDFNSTFPPFFGVPLSLKEVILFKGKICYVGHVYPINPIPTQHSFFMDIIFKMGFIPFVRSNVPPACKIVDTVNRIFGYCHNPWRRGRSCGGSSGGEGGLIGSGCSPIGIGTDIGGSVRIPAEWNGITSMKHGFRMTRTGNCFYGNSSSGLHIKSQIAPMARSVDDLILFYQFTFDPQNYSDLSARKKDIYIKQSPFNNSTFENKPKLTIGYQKNIDGQYRVDPAHERVLDQVLQLLEKKGHTIKRIEIPELWKVFEFMFSSFTADNSLTTLEEMRGKEPPIKEYKIMYLLSIVPWIIRYVLIWLLKNKQPRFAKLVAMTRPLDSTSYIKKIYLNQKKRQQKIYRYLADKEVDVWLMPGFPLPAVKHGSVWKFNYLISNGAVWNALHYPAGTVPIDLVKPEQTNFHDDYEDMLTKNSRREVEGSEGLPVGVQVISYPSNDEQVLYMMKEIEIEVKFRCRHVCPLMEQRPVF